jgi:lipoprotein-anchoring transpeptidase ErfK/SrfK
VLSLALAATGIGLALTGAVAAASPAPRTQALVAVLHDHLARARPNADAERVDVVQARRPLTRVRTVLPVLATAGREDAWLRVRLPGRPNGHTGWISARGTRGTSTGWRIRVSLSKRRVSVYRDGRGIRSFRAVIGKPSTPTPRGSYFVEEALALSAYEPGAPYALATSARSNVLQEFEGGPGQIALHGTRNISGALGTAVSHGCIRLSTRAIAWLASRIGAGVPLTIGR